MGRCSWDGFVRSIKLVLTCVFSHVGLCACVVVYLIAGAYLFKWLEQQSLEPEEFQLQSNPELVRSRCVDQLYNLTERTSNLIGGDFWVAVGSSQEWRREAQFVLEDFEQMVKAAMKAGHYEDSDSDSMRKRWNFIGSLFYCVTVITTIGYGHVAPQTGEGKMVTIVYAVFGIPLMLLCLTNIGNSMALTFRFAYSRVCCGCCRDNNEQLPVSRHNLVMKDNQNKPSNNNYSEQQTQWVPPPQYKPKRRNMLISPPISTTIYRGSDDPFKPKDGEKNETGRASGGSKSSGFISSSGSLRGRPPLSPLTAKFTQVEMNKIIEECASYAKENTEGKQKEEPAESHEDQNSSSSHHHSSSSSSTSPLYSPSSPSYLKDSKWNKGNDIPPKLRIPTINEGTPSPYSTRPTSPSLIWQNDTTAFSFSGRPSPNLESSVSVAWSTLPEDDDTLHTVVQTRPKRATGKTLLVYNTLSGDALLQQSKIQRRMALLSKRGKGPTRGDPTTMFTDPISGEAVDGDMLGLNYRPIPHEKSSKDTRVPIPLVLAFVAAYLGIGSVLFGWLEGWPYLDAGYFCFITLSTIGFGDFVPGKSLGFETWEAQVKLVIGSLYLLLGLAVLAMSFTLVQEEVILKCKAFANYIGLLKESV